MSDRLDLSDEDQDIDIESDEDDTNSAAGGNQFATEAEKKAHHNLLERKRRDHIKSSFVNLRDSIPLIRKEKSSRAQILKSATEYIQFMTKKNSNIQKDIENMKRQNNYLRQQLVTADKLRPNGAQSALASSEFATYGDEIGVNGGNSSEESTEANEKNVASSTVSSRRRKRQRVR